MSDISVRLKCGCWFGRLKPGAPERWHFCDKAPTLYDRWFRTGTVKDHDKYQNHFKR